MTGIDDDCLGALEVEDEDFRPDRYTRLINAEDLALVRRRSLKPDYSFQEKFVRRFSELNDKISKDQKDGNLLPRAQREFAIYAATGTGKTKMGADCMLQRETGVWFAHTEELQRGAQTAIRAACQKQKPPIPKSACQICQFSTPREAELWVEEQKKLPEPERVRYAILSISAFGRETNAHQGKRDVFMDYLKPQIAVCDEAHHCQNACDRDTGSDGTFDRVVNSALDSGATMLHLSATPIRINKAGRNGRLETRELNEWQVIGSLGLEEAIRRGVVSELEYVRDMHLDPVLSPDQVANCIAEKVTNPSENEKGVLSDMTNALGLPERHRVLYFINHHRGQDRSIEDALVETREKSAVQIYSRLDVKRKVVTASISSNKFEYTICDPDVDGGKPRTVPVEREKIVEAFNKGELDALCNFGVFTEGTDLPSATLLLLNRPTQSSKLSAQMIGRILRSMNGAKRKAFIIDPMNEFEGRMVSDLITHIPYEDTKREGVFEQNSVREVLRRGRGDRTLEGVLGDAFVQLRKSAQKKSGYIPAHMTHDSLDKAIELIDAVDAGDPKKRNKILNNLFPDAGGLARGTASCNLGALGDILKQVSGQNGQASPDSVISHLYRALKINDPMPDVGKGPSRVGSNLYRLPISSMAEALVADRQQFVPNLASAYGVHERDLGKFLELLDRDTSNDPAMRGHIFRQFLGAESELFRALSQDAQSIRPTRMLLRALGAVKSGRATTLDELQTILSEKDPEEAAGNSQQPIPTPQRPARGVDPMVQMMLSLQEAEIGGDTELAGVIRNDPLIADSAELTYFDGMMRKYRTGSGKLPVVRMAHNQDGRHSCPNCHTAFPTSVKQSNGLTLCEGRSCSSLAYLA